MRFLRRLRVDTRATTIFGGTAACALVLVAGFGTTQRAEATNPTCSSVGFTLTPLHGTRFLVDSSSAPVLDSGYTGVSISPAAAKTNVWVKLSGFTGGARKAASNRALTVAGWDTVSESVKPRKPAVGASVVSSRSSGPKPKAVV